MRLPFTHQQFLDVFGAYNTLLWPAVVTVWLVTALSIWNLQRGARRASRGIVAVLVVHWAWSAIAYHFAFFRSINPAATPFGVLFLAEGLLIAWRGLRREQLDFGGQSPLWRGAGLAFVAYSFLYPVLGPLSGLNYPRVPLYAVPCPTTVLTAGVLLTLPRREARILAPIPLVWAGIGGSAALTLGILADLALPVSGLVLFAYVVTPAQPVRKTHRLQARPVTEQTRTRFG